MDSTSSERRRHPRHIAIRSCKVRTANSARYIAGQTTDVSASGMLMCVGSEHEFKAGDAVELAVAWSGESVLRNEVIRTGVVRRVSMVDEHQQAVGVEFDLVNTAAAMPHINPAEQVNPFRKAA